MSITHAQYEAQIKSAEQAKLATVISADTTFLESVNASGVNVGYNTINGNYANFAAAVKSANAARLATRAAAEIARQQAIMVQRDLLRDSGNREPL